MESAGLIYSVGGTQQVTPWSTVLFSQLFTFYFMEPKKLYTF